MPIKHTKSKRAERDFIDIVIRSMADFGEEQTDKYMAGLEATLEQLANYPDLGPIFTHKNLHHSCRRHLYKSHVIYYRKRKHDIFIIRILHATMLAEKRI